MSNKISQAKILCQDIHSLGSVDKGIAILKDLVTNLSMSQKTRIHAVETLLSVNDMEAYDIISKIRDSLPFLNGERLNIEIDFLVELVKNINLSSHERIITNVWLFNNGILENSYKNFCYLANDKTMKIDHRIESIKYMFYSETPENEEASLKSLLNIILDLSYTSEYRYNVIVVFSSKNNITTFFNFLKLRTTYNENFSKVLQLKFFEEGQNGLRERILSGQCLLQMTSVDDVYKNNVINILLNISNNRNVNNKVRADAIDVILRFGSEEQRARAMVALNAIREEENPLLKGGSRTAYNDSQNIHNTSLSESIRENILKLIGQIGDKIDNFTDVHIEVSKLINSTSMNINDVEKKDIFKSLDRISLDTATFTDKSITIAEIFIRVWMKIKSHSGDEKIELEKRFVEELINMSGTCSSGHVGRLINVLSYYDLDLRISWKDQVISNVYARLYKLIKDVKDDDIKASITMGMLQNADKQDVEIYITFITDNLITVREELYKEFVDHKYINEHEFDDYFNLSIKSWI